MYWCVFTHGCYSSFCSCCQLLSAITISYSVIFSFFGGQNTTLQCTLKVIFHRIKRWLWRNISLMFFPFCNNKLFLYLYLKTSAHQWQWENSWKWLQDLTVRDHWRPRHTKNDFCFTSASTILPYNCANHKLGNLRNITHL